MEENSEILRENLIKTVSGFGNDPVFIYAAKKHLERIKYKLSGKEIRSQQELDDLLLSKLFVDNVNTVYPDNKFACQPEENFNWDFEIISSEVFAEKRLSKEFRKEQFYKCLKTSHVLNCIVKETKQTAYHLRVISKYGSARLLCDLDIIVSLPIIPSEESLLKTTLKPGDLIRVSVLEIDDSAQCSKDIKVTLDEQFVLFTEKYLNLGIISKNELPIYIHYPYTNATVSRDYKSLTDYLNVRPEFKVPSVLEILSGFGLNVKRNYSFYPNLDKTCPEEETGQMLLEKMRAKDLDKTCLEEETGQMLLEKMRAMDLDNYLNLAKTEHHGGNVKKTLDALGECFEFDPNCLKAYEIRSKMYAEMDTKHLNKKALLDFEMVYDLDKSNETAKQYISRNLGYAARMHCEKRNYVKAYICCQKALELDKDNKNVSALLIKLKTSKRTKIRALLKTLPEFDEEENATNSGGCSEVESQTDIATCDIKLKQEKDEEM